MNQRNPEVTSRLNLGLLDVWRVSPCTFISRSSRKYPVSTKEWLLRMKFTEIIILYHKKYTVYAAWYFQSQMHGKSLRSPLQKTTFGVPPWFLNGKAAERLSKGCRYKDPTSSILWVYIYMFVWSLLILKGFPCFPSEFPQKPVFEALGANATEVGANMAKVRPSGAAKRICNLSPLSFQCM